MRRDDDEPVLRVRGPADLLGAVPYLLGFRPVDSLVVVGLRDKRVVVTARMDLADIDEFDRVGDPRPELSGPMETTLRALRDGGATDAVAAVWLSEQPFEDGFLSGDERQDRGDVTDLFGSLSITERAARGASPLPGAELAARLSRSGGELGVAVNDVLLVAEGRYWSYVCDDERCCPREGTPLEPAPPIAAAATFAGLTALPDRRSLEALLEPLPDRERLAVALAAEEARAVHVVLEDQAASEDRSVVRALFAAARAADQPRGSVELDDDRLAWFAIALQRISVRDSAWLAIDDERVDGRALWRHLARTLPAPYDAAPLFLFSWASWRAGDGVLAGIAAERAVASDPGYSAADMVLALLAHGTAPYRVPKLSSSRRAARRSRAADASRRRSGRRPVRSARRAG